MNPLQLHRGAMPLLRGDAGKGPVSLDQPGKLENSAVKFEGMFVAHLLGEMRKTNEAIATADTAQKPDAGLLDHAYRLVADDIAAQRAFGIADAIVAQMAPARRTP